MCVYVCILVADFETTAYAKTAEIDVDRQLAASLMPMFDQWYDGQSSNNVCERELCMAMRGSSFKEYCVSLLLSAIEMGIADIAAKSVHGQV
jgi:hypothetical protein